ncbi:hypothetical protein OROGR_015138 [Orobanche gracilis]
MFRKSSDLRYDDDLIDGLHEVWPSVRDGDGNPREPNEDANIAFWNYEWIRHEIYSGLDVDILLRRMVHIVKHFREGFRCTRNRPISAKEIISQIKKQIRGVVKIKAVKEENSNIFSMNHLVLQFDEHLEIGDMMNMFAEGICEDDYIVFR